jgi:phosphatidylglycerophosphate synthase
MHRKAPVGEPVQPQEIGTVIGDNSAEPEIVPPVGSGQPSLVDSYRQARAQQGAGGLFTTFVSNRLGSPVAAVAMSLRIHPSVISLGNLLLATIASVLVITRADHAGSWWAPGVTALVLWQLAYVLDCVDGQVARVTGKQSDFGARVDVLVDFAVQISILCAITAVMVRFSDVSPVLVALFATSWFASMITFLLGRADGNVGHSFSRRGSLAIEAIKLVRDYGFIVFILGGWLAVAPESIVIPVIAFTMLNSVFLVASIGREAWLSMRRA